MPLSFLEQKLVERSRFRNLEKALKQVSPKPSQMRMPASPAIPARAARNFNNPFESGGGQTVFSQRSGSMPPNMYNHMSNTMTSPFVSIKKSTSKHR